MSLDPWRLNGSVSRAEHSITRKEKSTGPNELPLVLLKLSDEELAKELTSLLRNIGREMRVPLSCDETLIVHIFKMETQ